MDKEELFDDEKLVEEVRNELVEYIDRDNIRGIILQSGNPETSIIHRRSIQILSTAPSDLANFIEERIELLSSIPIIELIESYL